MWKTYHLWIDPWHCGNRTSQMVIQYQMELIMAMRQWMLFLTVVSFETQWLCLLPCDQWSWALKGSHVVVLGFSCPGLLDQKILQSIYHHVLKGDDFSSCITQEPHLMQTWALKEDQCELFSLAAWDHFTKYLDVCCITSVVYLFSKELYL